MTTIARTSRNLRPGAAALAVAVGLILAGGAWAAGEGKSNLQLVPVKSVTSVKLPKVQPGHVTGLTITPTPAAVGQTVSVKFNGAGVCAGEAVIMVTSAGNGPGGLQHKAISAAFAADAPWPRVAAFVPEQKGSHWIYMAPPGDPDLSETSGGCFDLPPGVQNIANIQPKVDIKLSGEVGTTVGVAPCNTPTVKSLLVGGKIEPGDAVIVGGCGFGKQKGELHLVGDFPGGFVKLKVDSWSDAGIGAFVPADLSGAPDQTAKVQVVAKGGAKSNADKILAFEARRERVLISYLETANNCKKHEGLYGMEFESLCAAPAQNYLGKACGHSVCALQKGKAVINDVVHYGGKDDYQLSLKNGFVYDGSDFWSNSGADFAFPYTPPVGPKPTLSVLKQGAEAKLRVKWEAFRPTGWVEYKLKIYVVGPAGVPYS